jgi:hypothetical protein
VSVPGDGNLGRREVLGGPGLLLISGGETDAWVHEYMARAAQCQQKAESARNEDDEQSWLALADSWRYTAELQQRPQARKSQEAA